MGQILFHICKEHRWVSNKTPCQFCAEYAKELQIKEIIIRDIKQNGKIKRAIIDALGHR